jgi:hypothetical protein
LVVEKAIANLLVAVHLVVQVVVVLTLVAETVLEQELQDKATLVVMALTTEATALAVVAVVVNLLLVKQRKATHKRVLVDQVLHLLFQVEQLQALDIYQVVLTTLQAEAEALLL